MVQGIYFNEETREFSVIESTESYADAAEQEGKKKSKLKKAALIGAGIVGAGALGYAGYKYQKNAPARKLAKANNPVAAAMATAADDRKKLAAETARRMKVAKKNGIDPNTMKKVMGKEFKDAAKVKAELGIGKKAEFKARPNDWLSKFKSAKKQNPSLTSAEFLAKHKWYSEN